MKSSLLFRIAGGSLLIIFLMGLFLNQSISVVQGQVEPTPTPVIVNQPGDYGDAPDSSNNQGVNPNTAYPGTDGNFPTSYQGTALGSSNPPGPVHLNPTLVHLGPAVSQEVAADFGPDSDGVNNIVNGGTDVADQDGDDDGWLNPDVPFIHCERTTLEVEVTNNGGNDANMVLNVWFDGNRDGSWGQFANCNSSITETLAFPIAHEWIVRNTPLAVPAGTTQVFLVDTFRVPNIDEEEDHWIRFTLSEDTLPKISRDGSSPYPPAPGGGGGGALQNGHQTGETEDYLYVPVMSELESTGEVMITKSFDPAGPVSPGDVVNVLIDVERIGGVGTFSRLAITDELPPLLTYLGPIEQLESGNVHPSYQYDLVRRLISGSIRSMEPDSRSQIRFPVEVGYCYGSGLEEIVNIAMLFSVEPDIEMAAEASLMVDCYDGDFTDLSIDRRVVALDDDNVDPFANPNHIAVGEHLILETRISNDGSFDLDIGVEETIDFIDLDVGTDPLVSDSGIKRLTVEAQSSIVISREIGVLDLIGRSLVALDGQSEQLVSQLGVCLLDIDDQECPTELSDRVKYAEPLVLEIATADFGDAPDSTNHAGVPMNAYLGVEANFPTVYDPALVGPPGPMVINPGWLYLGTNSSREVEADIDHDQDDRNNLQPAAGVADLDLDDVAVELNVEHCETTTLFFMLTITPDAYDYFKDEAANELAFFNIWIDGNQDGDWDDEVACPGGGTAREHIAIDQALNIVNRYEAGTGFGDQYLVSVETTQVPWQEGSAVNNPRWMRLMVSDRRAELIPGLPYGDGRGPETPYLLGEIEDMLIINEFYPFIELSPDLEVGGFEIEPVFEGLPNPLLQNRQLEPGQRLYRASFDLVNRGADADEDLSLTVDFGDIAPNVTQYLLIPDISGEFKEWVRPCPAHGVCELPIGQLKENERIRGTFTFFMAEVEDEVVVDLSVNSPNDQNTGNNRRSFVFGPTFVSAPVIETVELSGNVLAGIDAIISGESTPNAELTLFLNSRAGDSFELTTPVNALGGWSAIFEDLDVGNYAVRASASLDGTTGPQSFPTRFTVSDDVGIDTLTVTDIDGNIMPVLQDPVCRGSLIFTCNYFPAGNYLLSARLTHADQQVQIGISGGEFGQLATLEDEDGDGIYTTELIVPEPISRSTSQTGLSLTLSMLANGSESAVTVDVTVADELGQVTDAETDAGIPGATIAISEIEPFIFNGELVDGLSMVHEGILTDADGSYAALVEPGSFQIVVTADSYQPMRQEMIIEQNGLLTLDLELAPDLSEAVSQTYLVTDRGGASTLLIEPGEVIDFINGGSGTLQLVGADWQSGLLLVGEGHQRAFETLGTYNLADGDGQLLVRVIVQDEEPLPPAEDAFFIFMPFIQED